MGWEREALRLGGEEITASVKRAGQRVEAVIPWRPGIGADTRIALDDGRYVVIGIRDPGERHEVLELVLAWVAAGPASSQRASKRRKQPKSEAGRDEAIKDDLHDH